MSNYISKLNETVERTHVRYQNRYGIALAGDLYTRIKAVVTASMFDMSAAARLGMTSEQIQERKERMSLQRWKDAENGEPEYIPSYGEEAVEEIPDEIQGLWREFFEFYGTEADARCTELQSHRLI